MYSYPIRNCIKTLPYENRIIVEGINLRTKHVKPTQEGESGRIVTEEFSLHASNVMLYSTEKKIASRSEIVVDKDGVKKRRLKKLKMNKTHRRLPTEVFIFFLNLPYYYFQS